MFKNFQTGNSTKKCLILFMVFVLLICLYPSQTVSAAPSTAEIFHDQGYIYMSPLEPSVSDAVVLRLRAKAGDLSSAQIKYYDYGDSQWHYQSMAFDYNDATGNYSFWKGTIPASSSRKQYRFSFTKDGVTYWYNVLGVWGSEPPDTTWDFWIMPGFSTPSWSKGALWYSIMPDSFYNSDLRNDLRTGVPTRIAEVDATDTAFNNLTGIGWGNKHLGGADWFGGDIKGITANAQSYLKNTLGITALHINPIWDSTHNAGYGQFDYTTVNPLLGTNEDLKGLISTLHANNIKITLDGVFKYHLKVGKWFNQGGYFPVQGAYQSQSSIYYPRFYFYNWPDNYVSDWGQPVLDYNCDDVRHEIYQNSDSIMQMYVKSPYNADGWRLDVGNTLWGQTLDEHTILKDMRPYLKSANSEAVFISEHASVADLNDNTLDSKWNYDFGYKVRDWAAGLINQNSNDGIDAHLRNALRNMPRPVACSSYNFLTTHDLSRIYRYANYDTGLVNCAQILQMTYLGAPSIYFGDEVGDRGDNSPGVYEGAPSSFNSFNWDRSTWNFKILNLYRSLAELRANYNTTLATGVIKTLLTDDTNKIYSFGRWDGNGKIITITNQSSNTVNVTISAKELSITNGTTMTDWLTGRTYTVSGGNITVPVFGKWGAVLVEGTPALGNFRNEYEVEDIGSAPAAGSTVIDSSGGFTIKGSGSIGGSSDSFQYASVPAFNDFSVVTKITSQESGSAGAKAGIMIRQSADANSKYYAVFAKQTGGFGYSYRSTTGGTASEVFSGATSYPKWLKVERINNVFKAYTAPDNSGVPGTWTQIAGSTQSIQMDTEVLQGLAVTSSDSTLKQAQFSGASKADIGVQKYDNFDNSVPGSMFSVINPDTGKYSISNSKLNITTTNSNKNIVVANAPSGEDWSSKVKISFSPAVNGQEADLLAYQDNDNYVKVFRIRDGGITKLGFGSVINGFADNSTLITDTAPGSDVYLQLHRVGSRYSAAYSTDGASWTAIGEPVLANFSKTLTGMTAKCSDGSSATSGFDYFSFGNTVSGDTSYNSSVCQSDCNTSFSGINTNTPAGNWVFGAGTWSYTEAGYSQTNTGNDMCMHFANKTFSDFYMDVSLKYNHNSGWGGVSFRRANYNDHYSTSGYLLWLTNDGYLSLYKNGSNLSGADRIPTGANMANPVRLQIVAKGENIKVFVNGSSSPTININDSSYSSGYTSLYTCQSKVDFKNISILPLNSIWTPFRGLWTSITNGVSQTSYLNSVHKFITLTDKAYRDVVVNADIKINNYQHTANWAGIHLHSSMGKDYGDDGLLVYLRKNGNIGMASKYGVYQEVASGANMSNPVNVKVIARGNNYKVFINGSGAAKLDVNCTDFQSGTVSLATEATTAEFTNVVVQGKKGNYGTGSTILAEENFDSGSAAWTPYYGTWAVENGEYSQSDTVSWDNGSTLSGEKYSNFTAEYKIKMISGGWAGVNIRKTNYNDTHQQSGYLIYLDTIGNIVIFKNEVGTLQSAATGINTSVFNTIKVVANGSNIKVYVNGSGTPALDVNDSSYTNGYISLVCGQSHSHFDDVKIY